MTGATIAAEVAAGLAEAGTDTGNGPLVSTLRKRNGPDVPWNGAGFDYDDAAITVVQTQRKIRDGFGMVERTVRMLLIDATGVVPAKGDQVAVGVVPADVTSETRFSRIGEVETLAPGGVALMHKAMMEE